MDALEFVRVETTGSDLYDYEDIIPIATRITNTTAELKHQDKNTAEETNCDHPLVELECVPNGGSDWSPNYQRYPAIITNECSTKTEINCGGTADQTNRRHSWLASTTDPILQNFNNTNANQARELNQSVPPENSAWASTAKRQKREPERALTPWKRGPVSAVITEDQTADPCYIRCPVCLQNFATYSRSYRKIYESHRKSHEPVQDDKTANDISRKARLVQVRLRVRLRRAWPPPLHGDGDTSNRSEDAHPLPPQVKPNLKTFDNDKATDDITTIVTCTHCTKTFTDLASRGRHIRLAHRSQQTESAAPSPGAGAQAEVEHGPGLLSRTIKAKSTTGNASLAQMSNRA